MVSRVINPQLSGCVQPDNEDVVRGLLASIFADAGARTAAKKLEERIYKHDVCRVALLAQLTRKDLEEGLQMSFGEALVVDNFLFPLADQPEVIQAQPVQEAPPINAHQIASTSRDAPEFPALGQDDLPTAQDMRAWLPGFRSHLAGRVERETLLEYDALVKDVRHVLQLDFSVAASPESEAVMTALLQSGTKGLPGAIVLSIPPLVMEHRLGLVALKDLLARVFTVSDSSLGVLLTWFQKPDLVTQLWLLGLALTKWLGVRAQLAAEGLPQSDIACRLSLLYLSSKLADLKAVFAALQ